MLRRGITLTITLAALAATVATSVTCYMLKKRSGAQPLPFSALATSPLLEIFPADLEGFVVVHEFAANYRAIDADPAVRALLDPAYWRTVRGDPALPALAAEKERNRQRQLLRFASLLDGDIALAIVADPGDPSLLQLALAADRPRGWSVARAVQSESLRQEAGPRGVDVFSFPLELSPSSDRLQVAATDRYVFAASSRPALDLLLSTQEALDTLDPARQASKSQAGGWRDDAGWKLAAAAFQGRSDIVALAWLRRREAEARLLPEIAGKALGKVRSLAGDRFSAFAVASPAPGVWVAEAVGPQHAPSAVQRAPFILPKLAYESALFAGYVNPAASDGFADLLAGSWTRHIKKLLGYPYFFAVYELRTEGLVPYPQLGLVVPLGEGGLEPAKLDETMESLLLGKSLGRLFGELGKETQDYRGARMTLLPGIGYTLAYAPLGDRLLVALDESTLSKVIDAVLEGEEMPAEAPAQPQASEGPEAGDRETVSRQLRVVPGALVSRLGEILDAKPASPILLTGAGPALSRARALLAPLAEAREITLKGVVSEGYERQTLTFSGK